MSAHRVVMSTVVFFLAKLGQACVIIWLPPSPRPPFSSPCPLPNTHKRESNALSRTSRWRSNSDKHESNASEYFAVKKYVNEKKGRWKKIAEQTLAHTHVAHVTNFQKLEKTRTNTCLHTHESTPFPPTRTNHPPHPSPSTYTHTHTRMGPFTSSANKVMLVNFKIWQTQREKNPFFGIVKPRRRATH